MLMFTSCAWFFSDVSGIEVRQNLSHAARAIDLAQPFSAVDLEEELLGYLTAAQSNVPGTGTGADVWRESVQSMRKQPALVAMESFGLTAVGVQDDPSVRSGFDLELKGLEGDLERGAVRGRLTVIDRTCEETLHYVMEARRDPKRLMVMTAQEEGANKGDRYIQGSIDDLPPETRARIARALFADLLTREERRIDEIFEESRSILERYHDDERILPPVFKALAVDVLERRCSLIACRLADVAPRTLTGAQVLEATEETFSQAVRVGVEPVAEEIALVIERALDTNLRDPAGTSEEDASRSIGLLRAAEEAGIKIDRTQLEEKVYALLSSHWGTVAAGSADVPERKGGLSPDTLVQLAKLSNLSLRSFERMHSAASEENVEGVTG
jgi:hypothetical protein